MRSPCTRSSSMYTTNTHVHYQHPCRQACTRGQCTRSSSMGASSGTSHRPSRSRTSASPDRSLISRMLFNRSWTMWSDNCVLVVLEPRHGPAMPLGHLLGSRLGGRLSASSCPCIHMACICTHGMHMYTWQMGAPRPAHAHAPGGGRRREDDDDPSRHDRGAAGCQ